MKSDPVLPIDVLELLLALDPDVGTGGEAARIVAAESKSKEGGML